MRVKKLTEILPDLKIVLSSKWGKTGPSRKFVENLFKAYKIDERFVSVTPTFDM